MKEFTDLEKKAIDDKLTKQFSKLKIIDPKLYNQLKPNPMKELLKQSKTFISIKDLTEDIFTQDQLIVFYYTQSDEKYPAFLTRHNNGWGFFSPIVTRNITYKSNNLSNCLELASANKRIFILEKVEAHLLFKTNIK